MICQYRRAIISNAVSFSNTLKFMIYLGYEVIKYYFKQYSPNQLRN